MGAVAQYHRPMEYEPPASIKRRRWPWVVGVLLLIFVVLPLVALGWTGIWNVPVLSSLFGTNKPIDLGVHPTDADLQQALADNPMTFVDAPGSWSGMSVKRYSGTIPINDENTSAEVTAFIRHLHGGPYTRDIQVKYNEGGMEVSAFVVPYLKAPVYADVGITRTSASTVSLSVRKAKVGRLAVPKSYYDEIEREATAWVNERLAEVPGLSLDVVEYHDGFAKLQGTLPQTIEQIAGQEYSVLGKTLPK